MKPTRSGRSLIEVVVMLTVLSVVLGLSTTALATLFRVKQQFARDAEQAATISRLDLRLRADAHEAVSASAEDGCTFMLADGRTIHYAFETPAMIRQVRQGDAILHRDSFRLPRNAAVTFQREGDSPRSLIRLSVGTSDTPKFTRDLPRTATTEAAVGIGPQLAQTARQP
jgi:hypothetical protein